MRKPPCRLLASLSFRTLNNREAVDSLVRHDLINLFNGDDSRPQGFQTLVSAENYFIHLPTNNYSYCDYWFVNPRSCNSSNLIVILPSDIFSRSYSEKYLFFYFSPSLNSCRKRKTSSDMQKRTSVGPTEI